MAPKKSNSSGGYPSKPEGKSGAAAKAKPAAKPAAKAAEKAGGAAAAQASKKPSKADKAAAAAARDAAKKADLEDMMNPYSDDESEEEQYEAPSSNSTAAANDKRQAAAAAREQREQEQELQARARAEAVQRRAERLAEREQEKADKEATTSSSKDAALAAVLEKVNRVGASKLSNKERRLYARHMEKQEEEAAELAEKERLSRSGADAAQLVNSLKDFSVSVAGGNEMPPGAVDLRVEGFSISTGGQRLLDNCSLVLAKGRRYGLLGPNGGGKTTLLRHLAARKLPVPDHWTVGLVEQEAAATETAVVDEVIAADNDRRLLLAEEAELLAKIEAADSVAAEELEQLCTRLTAVGEQLEASGAEAAEASVRRILCGLGFTTEMADGPVNRLSGGWRMRVSLAKALFLQPDLLLLDEPTNHLDLDAVFWLDDYLCSYPKTLLVVSHDADFLDSACTDVVHLEDRQLHQYRGGYTEFRRAHAQRMKEREKEYKRQQDEKKAGKKVKNPEELVEKPKDYIVKFHFLPPIRDDEMSGISVHDATFSYSGKSPWLIRDLNFRVDSDTRVTIVGANGSGKSTLLSLISKVVEPCSGEVVHSRRLQLGRYSQHFDEIAPALHLTAVEFLTSPELRRFGAGTESAELAHKCLGQFGLPSHAHSRPMKELSGGQKARVCFASITCRRPEILILDEPTNHLDIESVEALIDALKKYSGGLLLVTHDARLVQATGCDLWVCRGAGESLGRAASFKDYRKEVLADLAKRQAAAEAEARRRAAARRQRRTETLGKRARNK